VITGEPKLHRTLRTRLCGTRRRSQPGMIRSELSVAAHFVGTTLTFSFFGGWVENVPVSMGGFLVTSSA